MRRTRRSLAATILLGAAALVLTGCITPPPLPTAAPAPAPVDPAPADPTPTAGTPGSPSETAGPDASAPPSDTDLPFTVDDGLGDTWSFDVVEVVADPPLASGAPEDGTFVVGVIIDARHEEGDAGFDQCFHILVEGTDGETYDYVDTRASITPEDDIFFVEDEPSFTGAVAAVQLPEGVEPASVILRSAYGYPGVEDTVFEIQ